MADEPSYVFSQNPSAVPNSRKKYREAPIDYSKHNLMWDKRVVRGNTYAAQIPTPNQILAAQMEQANAQRAESRRRMKPKVEDIQPLGGPVPGRVDMEVQTDEYLEEQDESVMEHDASCQTDFVIEIMDPVIKYRKPYGVDKSTVILDGELFDFDTAVEPILQTLLGKTLDHGREQVLQEQELQWWTRYQQKFEREREAVKKAQMEMEKEAQAAKDAVDAELSLKRARHKRQKDVAHKVASNSFARDFLANFQNHMLQSLEDNGVFYDPTKREVEEVFLPWIREQVFWQLKERAEAAQELDRILLKTEHKIVEQRDQWQVEREKLRKQKEEEERERLRLEAEAAAKAAEEQERKQAEEEEGEGDEDEDE